MYAETSLRPSNSNHWEELEGEPLGRVWQARSTQLFPLLSSFVAVVIIGYFKSILVQELLLSIMSFFAASACCISSRFLVTTGQQCGITTEKRTDVVPVVCPLNFLERMAALSSRLGQFGPNWVNRFFCVRLFFSLAVFYF
ncbi:transmembrane protein, putative [Medicago truncatula]|uniref:Transmembrane protein, putative n=1 Tax=Medicago truncatula TaxID=3880 RepID=G7JWH8_MEDTR|nr:transmembrane protein, putative [Medicago truncatula]